MWGWEKEIGNSPIGARLGRRNRRQQGNHERRTLGQKETVPNGEALTAVTHEFQCSPSRDNPGRNLGWSLNLETILAVAIEQLISIS